MGRPKATTKTTAELLKESAIKLFGTYGYEGTSVRLIAKNAGVTAGQITANFGSKENLLNEIVMDMYTSTCKDYDPIIGEYEYLKKNNLCTEKDVWKFIEKIIDIQINFTLDIKNIYAVQIMNVHMFSDRTRTSTKLVQLTKSKIEDTLAQMLRDVFKQKKLLHVKTISRAVNGAIVSFAEHPDLLYNEVVTGQYMPQAKEWMREYIKNYIMESIHREALRE